MPVTLKSIKAVLIMAGLIMVACLLGLQGVYSAIAGAGIAIIFVSLHIFSPLAITVVLAFACSWFACFYLAFHLRGKNRLLTVVLFILAWGALPLLAGWSVNQATARIRITGRAMQPWSSKGILYLVDKQAYQRHLPQRGDIIIYNPPGDGNQLYVSRILGLPGEQIKIEQGLVFVDGIALKEPYAPPPADYGGEWKVGAEQYFVLGDNRNDADDSHIWGTLPRQNMIGKVAWTYWPISSWGKIADVHYLP